jgi:hypothetical protein
LGSQQKFSFGQFYGYLGNLQIVINLETYQYNISDVELKNFAIWNLTSIGVSYMEDPFLMFPPSPLMNMEMWTM